MLARSLLIDFKIVNWKALMHTIPAMFALTFFGILHVPINVPALAVSTGEDNIDVDRELIAHGISNAFSGLAGSIQNYLGNVALQENHNTNGAKFTVIPFCSFGAEATVE